MYVCMYVCTYPCGYACVYVCMCDEFCVYFSLGGRVGAPTLTIYTVVRMYVHVKCYKNIIYIVYNAYAKYIQNVYVYIYIYIMYVYHSTWFIHI